MTFTNHQRTGRSGGPEGPAFPGPTVGRPLVRLGAVSLGPVGRAAVGRVPRRWQRRLGLPARKEERQAILLLAAATSLSSADGGALGALAGPLERSLHFGNTRLGLLVTVSSLVGAAGCIPMGVLADRRNRKRLLVGAMLLWSLGMAAMACAGSYTTLLASRAALGIATSAAGPVVASLTGDLFPAGRRARIYGLVLTGEIVGSGIGLLGSTVVQSLADWRAAFVTLAAVTVVIAASTGLRMAEPPRGALASAGPRNRPAATVTLDEADGQLVVGPEQSRMGPWSAARYILRIPSNRALILSSALGYFFLSGLRTFAVVFSRSRYGLGPALSSLLIVVIGVGTLAGTVGGGRLADRRVGAGRPEARLGVAGAALVGAAALFVPGLFTRSVIVALPLYMGAATLLAAPNAPLDAARLDIVPGRLWGRAEAVRSVARTLLEGAAPLLFGFVSSRLSGTGEGAPGRDGTAAHALSPAVTHGMALTFMVMLLPLAASGLLLLLRRPRYRIDMATALASDGQAQNHGPGTAGIQVK